MKPITQHKDYLLAWEDVSNKFFLLCNTTYENQPETFCIQLPIHIRDQYIRDGHNNLMRWIKRINEDYQVGRFSESNPRLMFQYVVATDEQKDEVLNCFENQISLMDQEIIRLLYLMGDACKKVNYEIALGKNIPIEIFCLAFRFYYDDNPLVDKAGNLLLAKARRASALKNLEKNPVYGCYDAGAILLGAVTRQEGKVVHLKSLEKIVDQPNFCYVRQRLLKYIEQAAQYNNITIKDPQSGYSKIIDQFENEFPKLANYSLSDTHCVPHWMFSEGALTWERDCLRCLEKEFLNKNINVSWDMVSQALYLLHGFDSNFHSYSVGQAIKHFNADLEMFTKETVPKPIFPAAGNEEFIVGVWQTYFRLFDQKEYSRDTLKTVLDNFVLNWNHT
jgi:hypothetical protein